MTSLDEEGKVPVTASGFSRRQVLTVAGLAIGVGVIELGGPTPASAAPPDQQLSLEPVGDQPVAVLSGDGAAPAVCPRQLAVRVLRGATLLVGTQLTVTFDPRLFAPVEPAVVTLEGRAVATASAITTNSTTGLSSYAVTFRESVPAQGDLVAVMGTAHPLLYPRDLVRRPSPARADLAKTDRSAGVRRSLQPKRPSSFGGPATPWGIELATVWGRQSWGDDAKFWYYHPVQVTLRSVGPGKMPVPASFAISVDPRLVREVGIASVRLNNKPYSGTVRPAGTLRTGSVYQTRWRSSTVFKPGDILDVRLRVSLLTPSGALPTIKHPEVGLSAMGTDVAQRRTGQASLTRHDSVWQ